MKILDKLNRNDIERALEIALKEKNSLVRKAKKLQRDPELFFKDVYQKRSKQLIAKIPVKYDGENQFTVVSAVYNVEKYLDEYFVSLTNQTLDFKKHIQVIMVDDGSTDNSANIIKKWQKKYPNNIHYYYKENGGQASARDYGLDYIKTEWCTFIDPDDFVDIEYFRNIDVAIQEQKDLWMVSCNLIYYYEQSKQYKDTHPQNYKFRQDITCFDVRDQNQYIQLSVSLAILNTGVIKENKIRFDTRIRPSFEDATFMMNYALALHKKQGRVAFVKGSKYYYRKREDGTSTLDTGWVKPSGYDEVLRYGCLATVKKYYNTLGYVPRFIQKSVMYYHIWQIKEIVNRVDALNFLTQTQKDEYLSLLRQIFEYIDEEAIDDFGLAGAWFFHKAGMLNLYKNRAPSENLQIVYVEKYDATKNQLLLYYFAPKDSMAVFYNQGKAIEPAHSKILRHSFLDEAFVYEYRYWVPLSDNGDISVFIDGSPTKIGFAGKHIRTPIKTEEIQKHYQVLYKYPNIENSWIIMDRDVQADDNAEHFYRYVMTHHPQQKIYFALRRESHDWDRLEQEGFNLLDFGTPKFDIILRSCSKIISSHADDYIVDYFGDKGLIGKDFVFLPHGVTQNDLHEWYNSKIQNLSLMTVATKDEYHSIADDNNHYKYGKKEIRLTGFPRHDALLRGNQSGTKRIVVMPTWRKYLLGKYDNSTGAFLKSPDFMQSDYAQRWQSFLQSQTLQRLIKQYGYEVIFAPHKNTEVYLEDFKLPANISIWKANPSESIQKLFQTSDIMITDYSSVAFEMGYLGKPVLYYQFDFEEFFKGQWQRGYFDYKKHGFGAVSDNQEKLLLDLEDILKNNGKALPEYQHRIDNTFAYQDDKNCERVYEEVVALGNVQKSDEYSQGYTEYLLTYARKCEIWSLLESLNLQTLNDVSLVQERHALEQEVCRAMLMQGKYQQLNEFLLTSTLTATEQQYWQARLNFWRQDYESVIKYFNAHLPTNNEDAVIYLLAAAYGADKVAYHTQKQALDQKMLTPQQAVLVEVAEAIYETDHKKVIALLNNALKSELLDWDINNIRIYKPQLILANSANVQEDYNLSYSNIRQHNSKLGTTDYASNVISAQMDYAKGSYNYAIEHYDILINQGISLTNKDELCYLKALCYRGEYGRVFDLINKSLPKTRSTLEQEVCRAMLMQGKYQQLNEFLLTSTLTATEQQYWQARLNFWRQDYESVIKYFNAHLPTNNEDAVIYLLAAAYGADKVAYHTQKQALDQKMLTPQQAVLVEVAEAIYETDHKKVIALLNNALKSELLDWDINNIRIYKPQLILANSANVQEDYNLSYSNIRQHNSKLGTTDYASNVISAQMDYAKGSYNYAIEHYDILINQGISLTNKDELCYLKALCYRGEYGRVFDLINKSLPKTRSTLEQEVCRAMLMQGKYQQLNEFLLTSTLTATEQQYWQARLNFWRQDYESVIKYFNAHLPTNNEDAVIYLLAAAYGADKVAYHTQKQALDQKMLTPQQAVLVEVAEAIYETDHKKVIALLNNALKSELLDWDINNIRIYKPQLILANSANVQEDYNLSYSNIRQHNSKLGTTDYASNVISAQMDYAKGSYNYAIEHYDILINQGISLTNKDELCYLKALCYRGEYGRVAEFEPAILKQDDELLVLWVNLQIKYQNWSVVIDAINQLDDKQKSELISSLVLAYYRTGFVDEAYQAIRKPSHLDGNDYWAMVMEIALLKGDMPLAKYAYQGLIARNPDKIAQFTEKFQIYSEIGLGLQN